MDLKNIRQNIDRIDKQLLLLFKERMNYSIQVATYKKEHHLPIFNSEREKEILDKVETDGGEFGYQARVLFADIMELSKGIQYDIIGAENPLRKILANAQDTVIKGKNLKIALQGIEGANSHEATNRLFPECQPILYKSFEKVFKAVENGEADYGVLPVENSSAGSVSAVYDLILKYRFYIVEALNLPIDHCLCGLRQSEPEDIEQVWSHPQALSQCSDFISEHNLKTVNCTNTAVAAKNIAQEKRLNCAAICTEKACKEYGLKILAKSCQNYKNNSTRFIVISKQLIIPQNSDKISLCFSLPHSKGALYTVLGRFNANGLNITKLESRPRDNGTPFEYLFYLDFDGNTGSKNVMNMLCALSEELPEFSFLGNYRELS